jgi:tRNA threonylcarbamoyl adenosine modification protein (Sua5/YciO/YrdC/YwlC family)
MAAVRLEPTPEAIARCAEALAHGELVAFPTETVYGLGAHALDPRAVEGIFRAKRRPHTDPLIVHVASAEAAFALAELEPRDRAIAERLSALWPGPLTLVLRARALVPPIVRAGGDTVGLRVPAHPVAMALLEASRLPIAAPSANRFGHVSPTTAAHVLADLGEEALTVLDGGPCRVGIESTVARVEAGAITVLRRGVVPPEQLASIGGAPVEVHERHVASAHAPGEQGEQGAQTAPGQLLTHYAPRLPTFLFAPTSTHEARVDATVPATSCALVDLGGRATPLAPCVRVYVDLSATGDAHEAAARLFATLRELEARADVDAILLPDLHDSRDEAARALFDRLFRAASGRRARIHLE